MNDFKPEVLSPVGSAESLEAAVRSGADAVYLGAKEFSARRNADNFDDNELKTAVSYCHIRNVKVYLTLNIMLKQSELKHAYDVVKLAYFAGVDALIIQDLGIASVIKRAFPDFELHASTQMSLHSPAALPFLKKMGFSRVVAAREMSKENLRDFCSEAAKLGMTVEVFVHGALCMCVSGQCLLSSVLGARSGNRGLCAGPCRLPFSAPGGTGYDLSLKDLSLYNHINELKEMGVASLKIEGRMKRPEYIAAATHACRQAVDCGKVEEILDEQLRNVFSRSGFTDGYFTSNTGLSMFGTRTKDDVTAASDAFPSIHGIYRAERQSVPIDFEFVIEDEKAIAVTVTDGESTFTVKGNAPEKAKNKSVTEDDIFRIIGKLGSTPYFARKTDITVDDGLFVPTSVLNELRRRATDGISSLRAEIKRTDCGDFRPTLIENRSPSVRHLIARFVSPEQIPDDISMLSAIILPTEADFKKAPSGIPLIADLLRWIENEDTLYKRLCSIKEDGVNAALCSNLSAAALAKRAGLKVIAGSGLNIMNTESIAEIGLAGADAVVLSAEMQIEDAVKIPSHIKKGIFAYGRLPLMCFKNCPLKNGITCNKCDKKGYLTDRLGINFPVRCRPGYSELLNSTPLYLADRLGETKGLDFLMLWFTDESKADASHITECYLKGAPAPENYTRGLYYRTLL